MIIRSNIFVPLLTFQVYDEVQLSFIGRQGDDQDSGGRGREGVKL